MTHGRRRAGRDPELPRRALALLAQLMGDAEPDVQKALSWAYRSLAPVDPAATVAALEAETTARSPTTTATAPGSSAIRCPSSTLPTADAIRGRLAGIRKRPGAPATSRASEISTRFGELPDPAIHPEPPLT